MLLIQPRGLSHPKKRCQDCAGEAVPAEIGDEGELVNLEQQPIERLTRVSADVLKRALPFDHAAAAARNDE